MRKLLATLFVFLLIVPLGVALYHGQWAMFFMLLVLLITVGAISGFFGWSTGKRNK